MSALKEFLSIGDTVNWCGMFGQDIPKDATVTKIEMGLRTMKCIQWVTINHRRVTITLSSGHTTYASRLKEK